MPRARAQAAFAVLHHHRAVQALLAAAGATPCHLVGGVLRDRLLGLPAHDIDAAVDGRGSEIAETLAAALPARLVRLGGRGFAAYRLVAGDVVVDLWDYAGTTLEQDLARRDFTVNSFAWEPRTGTLIDPFDGVGDLGRRLLRATTPQSFTGDPLRVLRLPRLAVQLPGFAAEPAAVGLARAAAPHLVLVAAERVREEIARLLDHPEAHRGVALLAALDLYPGLWLGQPGEPGPHGVAGAAVRDLEELLGAAQAVRETAARNGLAGDPPIALDLPAARQALLFRHLPGGEPAVHLTRCRDAGYLPAGQAFDIADLLKLAEHWPELPTDDLGRRRFLHAAGPTWATAAAFLGARALEAHDLGARAATAGPGAQWQSALGPLAALAHRAGPELFDPPRLLTGEEVVALLGLGPGPQIGRALAALRAAQVDGAVRTREEAEALIAGLGREMGGPAAA
jgi:poly(A) polymerase